MKNIISKHFVKGAGVLLIALVMFSSSISAMTMTNKEPTTLSMEDNDPPTIEFVNPSEGWFHFSGIRLFPTQLDLIADTMGFGGFRVKPVQVLVEDDIDSSEDISVYMYVKDDEQGAMTYNSDSGLHERKWIGPDLGVFTLEITATDTSDNSYSLEMEVWYFCFIPEA